MAGKTTLKYPVSSLTKEDMDALECGFGKLGMVIKGKHIRVSDLVENLRFHMAKEKSNCNSNISVKDGKPYRVVVIGYDNPVHITDNSRIAYMCIHSDCRVVSDPKVMLISNFEVRVGAICKYGDVIKYNKRVGRKDNVEIWFSIG